MKAKDMEAMPINVDLLNLITPQGIEIKNNKVQLGETTHKLQYISGYPSMVNLGWLMNLKDMKSSTVSLLVTPIEDIQGYVEGISKGLATDKNTYNTTNNEALRTQAEFKIASAEKIIKDITVDNIPYINLSFLTRTSGKTDNTFIENCRKVKNEIAGMGLKARVPAFIQEKALRQASPYDTYEEEILEMSNKNMSLEALFLGLPFSGSGIVDKQGYYLGTDEDGKIIILSPFCKTPSRPNSNVVITGASGSGKSYLAKKILFNEWLNGTKIYAIDPEGEMRDMCRKIKGKWVDCSGGIGQNVGRLNPLQVNPLPTQTEEDEEDEYVSTKSALSLHMSFLSTFFKLYFPDITTLQMSLLMEAIEKLYKNYNIDWDTDVTKLKSTEFPIMENLYYLLEDKSKENSVHKQHYETLKSVIRGLAIGESKELFNGHSTIKIDNSFVCFDVSALQNSNENIKRCQYLNILRFCENLAFRDRNEKVYVACDEAYLLIDRKIKESIEFLRNFCKRCRKYQSGLMIISQNLVDFLAPEVKQYGQTILDNSTYKFFFGTDGQDLVEIVRIYNLNQDEKAIISQKDQRKRFIIYWSRSYAYKC